MPLLRYYHIGIITIIIMPRLLCAAECAIATQRHGYDIIDIDAAWLLIFYDLYTATSRGATPPRRHALITSAHR